MSAIICLDCTIAASSAVRTPSTLIVSSVSPILSFSGFVSIEPDLRVLSTALVSTLFIASCSSNTTCTSLIP